MNSMLENLKQDIEALEDLINSNPDDEYSERYYNIEAELNQISSMPMPAKDESVLRGLEKRMRQIRNDLDLYDEQGERDAMFPNGEDD